MAKFTQRAIQMCLLELLQEKSIDKVSVKDICERCEINRNTFYYYYSDIYAVLEDLLRMETEKNIQEETRLDSFYDEYLRKYHLVLENKKAVWHIYDSKHRDLILRYFYAITENFIRKYVVEEAKGTDLSEEDISFVVSFYSNSMIGNTLRWLGEGMHDNQEELIRKLTFYYHSTIRALIEGIQQEKLNS